MKTIIRKHVSTSALIAGLAVAAWSPNSYACTDTPVIASICIMAVPFTYGNFDQQYVLAMGQNLSIAKYTALYSLIGDAYGSVTQNTFKIPDLRGKFVVGAGDGAIGYVAGATGGHNFISLTVSELPIHVATLSSLPININNLAVSVSLPTLTGTANIASTTGTGTVTGLKMNVANTTGGVGTPSGNYLGKATFATGYAYTASVPDATLNAGAISGGSVSVKTTASTATVTMPGGTLSGLASGTASVSGNSQPIGGSVPIDIRPSYIALTYYIAADNGLYPSRD